MFFHLRLKTYLNFTNAISTTIAFNQTVWRCPKKPVVRVYVQSWSWYTKALMFCFHKFMVGLECFSFVTTSPSCSSSAKFWEFRVTYTQNQTNSWISVGSVWQAALNFDAVTRPLLVLNQIFDIAWLQVFSSAACCCSDVTFNNENVISDCSSSWW